MAVVGLAATPALAREKIHDLLRNDQVDAAIARLDKHPELLDRKDLNWYRPLHIAADRGQVEMVRLLLERGADTEAKTTNGDRPLRLTESVEIARLLLDAGADPDGGLPPVNERVAKSHPWHVNGFTPPIELAAHRLAQGRQKGRKVDEAEKMVHLLREAGATYTFRTAIYLEDVAEVRRVLETDIAYPHPYYASISSATISGNAEIVGLLIDHGIDPNTTVALVPWLCTASEVAGATDVVRVLLKRGARPNAVVGEQFGRDTVGFTGQHRYLGGTALHHAAFAGSIESAKLLLDAGANVNASSDFGVTPLMAAASQGRIEFVRLLLAKGADKQAETKGGKRAVDLVPESEPDTDELLKLLR